MFFDPQCKPEVKADPFTLESLIAWLEKQRADKPYTYSCGGTCLLAQYFTAMGLQNVNVFADGIWSGDTPCPPDVGWPDADIHPEGTPMPPHFNSIARSMPHIFGAALERARAVAASRS